MTSRTDLKQVRKTELDFFHLTPYLDVVSSEQIESLYSDPDSIPLWHMEPSDEDNRFNKLSDYFPRSWRSKKQRRSSNRQYEKK